MTIYGPSRSPEVITAKALERKKLLERIRRQRAIAAANLRQKLLKSKHDDFSA
jgi:hypothetical protein